MPRSLFLVKRHLRRQENLVGEEKAEDWALWFPFRKSVKWTNRSHKFWFKQRPRE